MRFRRRQQSGSPADGAAGADQSSGASLRTLREAGDGFLEAADRAIEKALSGDSERFLRDNRQQGGQ